MSRLHTRADGRLTWPRTGARRQESPRPSAEEGTDLLDHVVNLRRRQVFMAREREHARSLALSHWKIARTIAQRAARRLEMERRGIVNRRLDASGDQCG